MINYLELATECAKRRRWSMCDRLCNVCVLDISRYNLSPDKVATIQHSATLAAWTPKPPTYRQKPYGIALAITAAIIFGIFCITKVPKNTRDESKLLAKIEELSKKEYESYTLTSAPTVSVPMRSEFAVMRYVQENIYDIATWSGAPANEVNCVDYAVMSYMVGTSKTTDKYRIIHNMNPENGFNHLFVTVNGVAVEPQTDETMWKAWGNRYDSKYDVDVTDTFRIMIGEKPGRLYE